MPATKKSAFSKKETTLPPSIAGRRTTKSDELFQRACELMPGGVNSPVRAFRSVGGTPVFFKSGSGAEFVDVDGNHYIDFCQSWGSADSRSRPPQGRRRRPHRRPRRAHVRRAPPAGSPARRAGPRGIPRFDRVRFVSSGTEAVMSALRVARGVTGRPLILKFDGCYHGHADSHAREGRQRSRDAGHLRQRRGAARSRGVDRRGASR